MRGRGSLQEGDPFTEVMTLITHMYKQTAIAKVKEAELILILLLWDLSSVQLCTGFTIKTQHVQTSTMVVHILFSLQISVTILLLWTLSGMCRSACSH